MNCDQQLCRSLGPQKFTSLWRQQIFETKTRNTKFGIEVVCVCVCVKVVYAN